MIPPSSWCKGYLMYSLFRCEFKVAFAWIVKKLVFLVQTLWILKLQFEDWPFQRIFIKAFTFCSKNDMCQIVKKHFFCSNNAPEFHIFNFWRHQKLLLVAKKLQDSTLLFENNCQDIGISKLVSLFELSNADLKISLYVCVHIKSIPENFTFLILRIFELFCR